MIYTPFPCYSGRLRKWDPHYAFKFLHLTARSYDNYGLEPDFHLMHHVSVPGDKCMLEVCAANYTPRISAQVIYTFATREIAYKGYVPKSWTS